MTAAWWTILIAGVGTYAIRASFLAVAHRMVDMPSWAHRVLRQIPPAALAALVLPAFLRPEGHVDVLSPEMGAGLVAALVAWRTRNAAATLVVGMVVFVVLRAIGV